VHMNGRVYDPYVGRFLSPDPILQTLGFSQALNPFSYVMNNPLTLIDPSGYSWLSKLFRSVKRWFKSLLHDLNFVIGTILIFTGFQAAGWALISFPVHARIDNGKLGFSVVFRFGGAKVGYGSSARGPPSSIGGVPILYQTAADAGLPWLPSWDTAAKVLLPGYLSFSEAQRAFREGRTLDAVLWTAAGAAEIGLLVYTFGASSAVLASARGGAVAVNQAARGAAQLTGQMHHGVSRTIHRALEQHPNLRGLYSARASRFVTQAKDLASHRGYDTFHRNLDAEVAGWIRSNPNATQAQFESYLRGVYQRPDVLAHFPNGL